MSLVDKFVLDLEENGYSLIHEFSNSFEFGKKATDSINKSFMLSEDGSIVHFSGLFLSLYRFPLNSKIRVSTFEDLHDSIIFLAMKGIGISVDTHSVRRNSNDNFHFRSRSFVYNHIPGSFYFDQEEPVLCEFRNFLCNLSEETNCNFYAEPWRAFRLLE